MDFFISIYQLFLYQPIFNALVVLSQGLPGKDFGVAVITLTFLIRMASYPLGAQAVRAQKKFAELQPKIKEIQEKFKNKKEEQTKAILQLYKTAKVNPLASFLPILIQLPIFIVLYQIFATGLHEDQLVRLYAFVPRPESLDPSFLGILNLNEKSFVIALLAGAFQFVQLKQASPPQEKKQERQARHCVHDADADALYLSGSDCVDCQQSSLCVRAVPDCHHDLFYLAALVYHPKRTKGSGCCRSFIYAWRTSPHMSTKWYQKKTSKQLEMKQNSFLRSLAWAATLRWKKERRASWQCA